MDGSLRLTFDTEPGRLYQVERSIGLQSWSKLPDTIYGFGHQALVHLYDIPQTSAGNSSQAVSTPAAQHTFAIVAFDDGTAVASWQGPDGSLHKAYLPSFDLRYQGMVMTDIFGGTVDPGSPASPYQLFLTVNTGPKDPAVANIQSDSTQAGKLAKLTSQEQWVYDTLKDRADLRIANAGVPPAAPQPFDDRGNPRKQFFRVEVRSIDSNFDGTMDHEQFANGEAFDMDLDGDGIPNGYDRDLWLMREAEEPGAQFTETLDLLSNVFISEALFSNEFTNMDDDEECQDWIEIFNPTPGPVDLTGWFLSDRKEAG